MVVLMFLVSSALYFFSYPEVDPDLWGHLFFGKEIVQAGSIPLTNFYSYTASEHPWINHEWLSEVIFYGVYRLSGSTGLILLKLALGCGVIWLLDVSLRQGAFSLWIRAVTLVWAMAILSPGFNVRPQNFTYFLFAAFLCIFYRYEASGRKAICPVPQNAPHVSAGMNVLNLPAGKSPKATDVSPWYGVYWVPALMTAWVNLHGGFVAGMGALSLFFLSRLVTELRGGEKVQSVTAHLGIPLVLAMIALLLNPYGLRLLDFIARDLLLERPITEWRPIPLMDFSFLEFKLALVCFVLTIFWKGSWWRWDFILGILAALFALRHQRHTPLFAIAAAPFLAVGVDKIFLWAQDRVRQGFLASLVLVIALYQIAVIGELHLQHRFRLIVTPQEYPTQAAEFLKRNDVRGNLAAPFEWGEYLIWKLYPEVRVSIDGRFTTAYPLEVIGENFEWMRGGKNWKRLLERYPAEIAISRRGDSVTALMRQEPEWVYIYSDPIAFIFVRNVPAQAALLERFRQKELAPPDPPSLYFPG